MLFRSHEGRAELLEHLAHAHTARGAVVGLTVRRVAMPVEHVAEAMARGDARDLAKVFKGEMSGYAYGRQGNPTTAALESKITKMEDGVATACFATGIAMALMVRGGSMMETKVDAKVEALPWATFAITVYAGLAKKDDDALVALE